MDRVNKEYLPRGADVLFCTPKLPLVCEVALSTKLPMPRPVDVSVVPCTLSLLCALPVFSLKTIDSLSPPSRLVPL